MKVIRDEDKNSNKYIMRFDVEKGTRNKPYLEKELGGITVTTEEYSDLVLYMADGSKPRYANIEENKVRALQLMEQQFLKNKKCEKKLSNQMSDNLTTAFVCGVAGLLLASAMLTVVPSQAHSLFANVLGIGFPTIILAYGGIKGIIAKKIYNKLKEIKKEEYFYQNEDILKEADLSNENILENVKDKDRAAIAKIKDAKDKENDKQYFDINSIGEGPSVDALRKIKANIKREKYLGLVSTNEEVKEKTYVKKRT